MLLRFHPQQVDAQERTDHEMEGANSLLVHEPASRFFSLFFGNCGEIELLQFQLSGRMDKLHRRSVFGGKRRAQRFVAARHLYQASFKRGSVERAFDLGGTQNVIGRAAWFQLSKEPQSLLRKRQRRLSRHRPWTYELDFLASHRRPLTTMHEAVGMLRVRSTSNRSSVESSAN